MMIYKQIFLAFSILFAFNSCIDLKDNYTAPNWDTEVNIPLTTRIYSISEITRNSKYLSIDSLDNNFILMLRTDTLHERYGLENFTDNRLNINIKNQEIPLSAAKFDLPISYPDGIEVDSADFDSGTLEFNIQNTSDQEINAVFKFPNYLKSGNVLSIPIRIAPKSSYKARENLSGIKYTTNNSTDKSVFTVQYNGNIVPNGKTILDFAINETRFKYISGMIPSKKLENISDEIILEFDENIRAFRSKLALHSSELLLEANYISDIDNLFDLQLLNANLLGKTTTNQQMYMTTNGMNNLGNYLIEKGRFNTVFNNSNSNISDFISFLPDEIHLSSELVMNPFNKRGSARMTDSFDVKAVFNAWGKIKAVDVYYTDTVEVKFDSELRDNIGYATQAKITINIDNGIPMGSELKAIFTNDEYQELFAKSIQINPATADQNGISIGSTNSNIVIELTEAEIDKLVLSHYLILSFEFSSYDLSPVVLRGIDKLNIKAYCSIKYNYDAEGGN